MCIVGAGPVGMTAAARLASFGISSVLLEADPELRKQGSKACLIQGDALEVLDKFGCGEQIRDEGVTWHTARTYVRNREIRTTVYPRRIGFGPFVNISQYRIEQILLARIQDDPHCVLHWSHRVTAVEQDRDGVWVYADTPQGEAKLRCRYLIACDGVGSRLRAALGLRWTGYSHRDKFLITDIRARLPLAQERHFHYDPSFNPGRQVVIHPQPDDIWRIDWQLAPGADIEAERRTGEFDKRVRAVIGDIPYEVDWLSTYRFHQRVVDRFAVGRTFLAGDAAHALPPYGSRGMNSGIQDADNVSWKLALVLTGQADESLLETYHAERHAAALENLAVTEATIRFMVPPSVPRRALRTALLRLSRPVKSVRGLVNSGQMAEPHVYRDSPIVDPAVDHRLNGRFAPDGWIRRDGDRTRLREMFGYGFVALFVGGDPAAASRFAEEVGRNPGLPPVHSVLMMPADARPAQSTRALGVVHVDDPGLRSEYHVQGPTCFLVRPDGHIAATVDGRQDREVLRALVRSARCVATARQSTSLAR